MTPAYLSPIHHDGSARYGRQPEGRELQFGDEVTFRLRTKPVAPIERLLLRTCPNGEQFFAEMQSTSIQPNPVGRRWETTIRLHMPVTSYRFLLITPEGAGGTTALERKDTCQWMGSGTAIFLPDID